MNIIRMKMEVNGIFARKMPGIRKPTITQIKDNTSNIYGTLLNNKRKCTETYKVPPITASRVNIVYNVISCVIS